MSLPVFVVYTVICILLSSFLFKKNKIPPIWRIFFLFTTGIILGCLIIIIKNCPKKLHLVLGILCVLASCFYAFSIYRLSYLIETIDKTYEPILKGLIYQNIWFFVTLTGSSIYCFLQQKNQEIIVNNES